MPNINPFTLARPELPKATVELQEAGHTFCVQLQALDAVAMSKVDTVSREYATQYIEQKLPFFPLGDGTVPELDEELIRSAVTLMQAEVGPNKYSFEEWIAAAYTLPGLWAACLQKAMQLTLEGPLGNMVRTTLKDGSQVLSSDTQERTPNLLQG